MQCIRCGNANSFAPLQKKLRYSAEIFDHFLCRITVLPSVQINISNTIDNNPSPLL